MIQKYPRLVSQIKTISNPDTTKNIPYLVSYFKRARLFAANEIASL